MYKLIPLLLFSILTCCNTKNEVYLNTIRVETVCDVNGPPRINQSFSKDSLRMGGITYKQGLGTHAPSELHIMVGKNAIAFTATIGIDDAALKYKDSLLLSGESFFPRYVYDCTSNDVYNYNQGSTVVFKVLADGTEIFQSDTLKAGSKPITINLPIKGAKELILIADAGKDGSFADFANWANASVTISGKVDSTFKIYRLPSKVLVNHVGYKPNSFKTCLVPNLTANNFKIIDAISKTEVYIGKLTASINSWGDYKQGNFTEFTKAGKYYITSNNYISESFIIHDSIYDYCRKAHLNWFKSQRCGGAGMGWHGGCHLDDGKRIDNGKHQDVTGGWHDAGDLRKWGSSIVGLWALSDIAYNITSTKTDKPSATYLNELNTILDELRWGNKYFLAMQEPKGYMMSHIGGDVYKHGDNNYWTDGIIGNKDDRLILTKPADVLVQTKFIISQCNIGRTFNSLDKAYSQKCLQAAKNCYNWAISEKIAKSSYDNAAMLNASVEMFATFHDIQYKTNADNFLIQLLNLQELMPNSIYGYFWEDSTHKNIDQNLYAGNQPLIGLVSYFEAFKGSELALKAQNALALYVSNYLNPLLLQNPYNLLPYSAYTENPGGNLKRGKLWYRWCYVNNENNDWWNGINPYIASTGAILVKAGHLLGNETYIKIGQAQFDWILGYNPFNSSTVNGLGYNQPDIFKSNQHQAFVPVTNGAVMAGIGSTQNNELVMYPGWWQTCEYWMPAVAYTLMLETELTK